MHPHILIEQDGRLLRIKFNRPEDNGVSDSMAAALSEAVLNAHETSDAVVLSSVGPDFCTGRIRDAATPASPEAYARRPEYDSIFNSYKALRSCQVPVIGMLTGRVMGFGTAVAALCDVSFASDQATFNIPEIAHNVLPTMVLSALYDRMKLARGEKMVRSLPRSFMRRSWLLSIDSRNSSSLIFRSAALGPAAGLPRLAICWLRQFSSALGAVV